MATKITVVTDEPVYYALLDTGETIEEVEQEQIEANSTRVFELEDGQSLYVINEQDEVDSEGAEEEDGPDGGEDTHKEEGERT